jgi:uncharacterized integral membrane protein
MAQESPTDSPRPPAEARRLGGGAIASLTGLGLLLIFMIQNTERVRLDFLFWKFTWPLWLLTMASALLGALVWLGLGVMRRHRRRKARRQAPIGLTLNQLRGCAVETTARELATHEPTSGPPGGDEGLGLVDDIHWLGGVLVQGLQG